jgi:hypothetical protein
MRALVVAVAVVALWLAGGPGQAGAQSPPGLAPYARPDQRWSVLYPADRLAPEALPSGAVAFLSAARDAFAVVDTYEPDGDAAGNTGEGHRNRARETLAPLVGEVEVVDFERLTGPRPDLAWWDAVVSYTGPGGLVGRAYYAQPGRAQGDFRVRGVLVGSRGGDPALARLLDAVRDSYLEVRALPLARPGGAPLWAVYSVGTRAVAPEIGLSHFVAIYGRDGRGWRPISRVDLEAVDYQDEAGVAPASVESSRLWLVAEGGVGAHGGTFTLLSFDGTTLRVEVAHAHPSPGAGELQDLLGDGTVEVVLNESDPYVFCYACSVRLVDYRVLRWDGAAFLPVGLRKLPAAAPASAAERRANDRAVELAEAGLYLDAFAEIAPIAGAPSPHPAVLWNHALIDLVLRGRGRVADAYPLLGHAFYGGYDAAVGPMRAYAPADLFDPSSPLVAGTVAQGWESQLAERVERVAGPAIAARPDLAEAYFLRGWARQLARPGSAEALADVARAAQLAPADPLFVMGLLYLRDGALGFGLRQRVAFGAGGTEAAIRATLVAGQPRAYALRVQARQRIVVDRDGAALFDPDGRLVAMGGHRGRLDSVAGVTGDYTLVVFGAGDVEVKVTVPPLGS